MDFDPRTPFLRRAALEAGVSAKELRGPGYRLVLPGTFVAATTIITPRVRARAALLPYDGVAWASHASAARVYDLPIPTIADEHVAVRRAGLRRRHRGVKAHVGRHAATRVVGGVRVTEPLMLFVEMAELLTLVDLVVLGDAMVRRRLVTPEALVRLCADVRHKAASPARRAASYVRRDVDSPMETRLRMLLVLAGLPEPKVNLKVRDESGEVIRKYDLSYPSIKVAVEFHGKVHVLVPGAWEHDLERRDAVDGSGWRLLPVIGSGIYATPEQTPRRVHRALLARGLPGVPLRLSEEWRAHFRVTPTRPEHVRRM
jgi:very-short-patch-repair endonuclease